MATKKKMLMSSAGAAGAGGGGLDIDEVFSTYLYEGDGATTHTITNGIDLAGEGGLVWVKRRDADGDHNLTDTERGTGNVLITSSAVGSAGFVTFNVRSFNSNGFSVGSHPTQSASINYSGDDYASWTFRKAPKFFDVVTYSGSGSVQNISHALGSIPGMIITKRTDASENWLTYHRGLDSSTPENKYVMLNKTNAASSASTIWNDTAPTSTQFTVGSGNTNTSGATYVAYLFAHNDGDGEFGPDGDQDIIKCGSFSSDANSGNTPVHVELGWEPQWLMYKSTSHSDNWVIFDAMRGWTNSTTSGSDKELRANTSGADYGTVKGHPNATGFTAITQDYNRDYIYMAIRRGPLAPPESGTEVFDVVNGGPDHNSVPFPTDFVITTTQGVGSDNWTLTRLSGDRYMRLNGTDAEGSYNFQNIFADMSGTDWTSVWWNPSATNTVGWHWKRAPGFCDVVAYSGTGSARTVSHNLGVAPEMMWVKKRSGDQHWAVYHSSLGAGKIINLNRTNAASDNTSVWNSTAPTSSSFSVSTSNNSNQLGETYVAYLFASLPGISKVGSYTGNGSSQTIDCGFTSGARFILIRRTDATGDWFVFDTERGIVSGNDPSLALNNTNVERTTEDSVDPNSSGFIVVDDAQNELNVSNSNYIFYAIA